MFRDFKTCTPLDCTAQLCEKCDSHEWQYRQEANIKKLFMDGGIMNDCLKW